VNNSTFGVVLMMSRGKFDVTGCTLLVFTQLTPLPCLAVIINDRSVPLRITS